MSVAKDDYNYEEQDIVVMIDRKDVMENTPHLAPTKVNIVSNDAVSSFPSQTICSISY